MTDSRGSTALVYAVKGGHRNVVEFLLSCENWILDSLDQNTNTCLDESNGINKQNETLQEALIWASKLGHMEYKHEIFYPLDI